MTSTVSPRAQNGQSPVNTCKVRNGNGSKVRTTGGGCKAIEEVKKLSQMVDQAHRENLKRNELFDAGLNEQCRNKLGSDESKMSVSSPRVESRSAMKCNKENEPSPKRVNPFWTDNKAENHPMIPIPRPPRKVELRGGDLFSECLCLKWNGLQQDCPKLDCQGQDQCMTWPTPTCQPSGLGVPIVPESRIKKPTSPECDKMVSGSAVELARLSAHEAKVSTRRKLVKMAQEQYPIDRPPRPKIFRPCKVHDGRYRLRPLMRDQVTQTEKIKDSCTSVQKPEMDENLEKERSKESSMKEPSSIEDQTDQNLI